MITRVALNFFPCKAVKFKLNELMTIFFVLGFRMAILYLQMSYKNIKNLILRKPSSSNSVNFIEPRDLGSPKDGWDGINFFG